MKIKFFLVFKVGDEFFSSVFESNYLHGHSVVNVVK